MSSRVFELEDEGTMTIKIGEKEYDIHAPSALKMAKYVRASEDYGNKKIGMGELVEMSYHHLIDLGLPEKVVDKLSSNQITKLIAFVYESSEKK